MIIEIRESYLGEVRNEGDRAIAGCNRLAGGLRADRCGADGSGRRGRRGLHPPAARVRPRSVDRAACRRLLLHGHARRSEEHTSELQSLMPISISVFVLKKKTKHYQ